MATALARGWLQAGLLKVDNLRASDPISQARDHFSKETGTTALADNGAVVAHSDVVVLSVKPQSMPDLLAEIRPRLTAEHLIISIAAGVTLQQLADGLGADRRLIRVMPNTPCLVGASAAAYAASGTTTADDIHLGRSSPRQCWQGLCLAGKAARCGDRP